MFPGWRYLSRIPKVSAVLRPVYAGHHFAKPELVSHKPFAVLSSSLTIALKVSISYSTLGSEIMNEVCNHPCSLGFNAYNNASEMCWLHLIVGKKVQGRRFSLLWGHSWVWSLAEGLCCLLTHVLPLIPVRVFSTCGAEGVLGSLLLPHLLDLLLALVHSGHLNIFTRGSERIRMLRHLWSWELHRDSSESGSGVPDFMNSWIP